MASSMPTVLPYLSASAVYVAAVLWAARATLPPSQARATILSGLIGLPAALFLPWLERVYWSPVRVGGRAVGVEDLLISFAVSALAWYVVALRFRSRLGPPVPVPVAFRRSLAPGATAIGAFLAGWAIGLDPMSALLAAYALVVAAFLLRRPSDTGIALWGAGAFALAWFALVRVTFAAFPGFETQWSTEGVWGVAVAGVPFGEIAWAIAFGAFWPLFVQRVLGIACGTGATAALPGADDGPRATRDCPRRRTGGRDEGSRVEAGGEGVPAGVVAGGRD